MATKEATAVRLDQALDRMRNASRQLRAELGADLTEIRLTEKDPLARQAELAEKVADNLEALLQVTVTPQDDDAGAAPTDTEARSGDVAAKTTDDSGKAQNDDSDASGEVVPQPGDPITDPNQPTSSMVAAPDQANAGQVNTTNVSAEGENDGDTDKGATGRRTTRATRQSRSGSKTKRNRR